MSSTSSISWMCGRRGGRTVTVVLLLICLTSSVSMMVSGPVGAALISAEKRRWGREEPPPPPPPPPPGTSSSSGGMGKAEEEALFEVMESMAGHVPWRSLHPQPCSYDTWEGLVCEQLQDGVLHVTRLDFGYEPNPRCSSNASIPVAITRLSWLRSLFIFECFNGRNTTIPPFLSQLAPSLQELSLRANGALVGPIPLELSALSSLQLLSLSQNKLRGPLPPHLSRLAALQHLDLSDNLLFGSLPPELGSLQSLVILDLSTNSFTGFLPSSLGSLAKLQKLDLSLNSLRGPFPPEIGNLKSLQFLALNQNSINGPYPASMANLRNLQYLIMDNNPMNCTLPSFIGSSFEGLMALSLSNSGYSGTIPASLGFLPNLTVLSLDGNSLSGEIPPALGNLRNLYQLNLSRNSLSGAIPFSPQFVSKLGRNMDLAHNLGLCSQWSDPQITQSNTGGLQGVAVCGDPKYSTNLLSSSGTRLTHISSHLKMRAQILSSSTNAQLLMHLVGAALVLAAQYRLAL